MNSSSLLASVYWSRSLSASLKRDSGKLNLSRISSASSTPPMKSSVSPGCARSAYSSQRLFQLGEQSSNSHKFYPPWRRHFSTFERRLCSYHRPRAKVSGVSHTRENLLDVNEKLTSLKTGSRTAWSASDATTFFSGSILFFNHCWLCLL